MAGTLWSKNSGVAAATDPSTAQAPGMNMDTAMMATKAPSQPTLTPQFCFSPGALEDFLRLSRSSIDDTIAEHLSALSTPSSTPFDPASSSSSFSSRSPRRALSHESCAAFRDRVLFPAWHSRAVVLEHCARVAAAPDPDDPDAAAIKAEIERAGARVVNERLDPYSGRFFARETRAERLARTLRQENVVEDIVRRRSWNLVHERCARVGGIEAGQTWESGLDGWRRRTGVKGLSAGS